jgi:hypothetical protein
VAATEGGGAAGDSAAACDCSIRFATASSLALALELANDAGGLVAAVEAMESRAAALSGGCSATA